MASLKHARKLLAAPPFSSKIKEELLPGPVMDSEELARFCGQTVKTNYHPVGTAPMGIVGDGSSVVDARLRVHGVERLRVIDCSIMPRIVSGNTNAPAMAIGNKAASMIAAEHGA